MGKHGRPRQENTSDEYPVPLGEFLETPEEKSQLEKDIELIDSREFATKPKGWRLF